MQKAVWALAVLSILPVLTVRGAERAETADERELRQLKEERWPRAYREGDVALLDSILAPEFRLVDADGNWSTKQAELDYVAKHRPSYRAFRFEIRRLEVFENGTAIVAGRGVITGDASDPDVVFEYQSSNVLIKRNGRWQAVSSHVSGVRPVAKSGTDGPAVCPPPSLTRANLDALKQSGFEVSADAERNRIALLLPQCLGDPDPALRDGVAFEALSKWMRGSALEPATIRALAARLTPELRAADDAGGFRKPFVALVLSEVARADRIAAVLDAPARQALIEAAVDYLTSIVDYRGFEPRAGWRHGVAHGADLVLQLGLNPQVSADDTRRLLSAVATQVAPPRPVSYVFGEPERLARAVYFIHRRGVLGAEFWDEWLAAIGNPAPSPGSATGLARRHNLLAFLHALAFAGRAGGGGESGGQLAALADREITRLMGG